jgi:thiol:disulfide interchange protein DsbD
VKHIFGAVLIWMGVYYLQTPLALVHPTAPRALLLTTTAGIAVYLLFLDRSGGGMRAFVWVRRSLGIVAAALVVWLLSPAPPERIEWRTYSDAAFQEAVALRRPILLDFTADWCAACKELEHKTFSDPAVGRAAGRFVALRADMTNFGGPEAKQWQKRYGIKGLPTVVRLVPL